MSSCTNTESKSKLKGILSKDTLFQKPSKSDKDSKQLNHNGVNQKTCTSNCSSMKTNVEIRDKSNKLESKAASSQGTFISEEKSKLSCYAKEISEFNRLNRSFNQVLEMELANCLFIPSIYEHFDCPLIKSRISSSLIDEINTFKSPSNLEGSVSGFLCKEATINTGMLVISRNTFNQIIYIIENVGRVAHERRKFQTAIQRLIDILKEDLPDIESQIKISELIEVKKTWREDIDIKPKKKKETSDNSKNTCASLSQPFTSLSKSIAIKDSIQSIGEKKVEISQSNNTPKVSVPEKRVQKGGEKGYHFYKNDPSSNEFKIRMKEDIMNYIQFIQQDSLASAEFEWIEIEFFKTEGYSIGDIIVCFGFAMIDLAQKPNTTTEMLYKYIYEVISSQFENAKLTVDKKRILIESAVLLCQDLLDFKDEVFLKMIYVWGGVFYLLKHYQVIQWRTLMIEKVFTSRDHIKCFFDIITICSQYIEDEDDLQEMMHCSIVAAHMDLFKESYNEYAPGN